MDLSLSKVPAKDQGQLQSHQDYPQGILSMVCLNPECPTSADRYLHPGDFRKHPQKCLRHLYSCDQVIDKDWRELTDYPSDWIGKSLQAKVIAGNKSDYFASVVNNLDKEISNLLQQFKKNMADLFPQKLLEESYMSVYSLEDVSKLLRKQAEPQAITKALNTHFSLYKMANLRLLNESYEENKQKIDNFRIKCQQYLQDIVRVNRKAQKMVIPPISTQRIPEVLRQTTQKLDDRYRFKINFGMFKSKFISSTKIQFDRQTVNFPKIDCVSHFLPWVYTDASFFQREHELKIVSLQQPFTSNAGFTVLEEQDIDTYPYQHFKSLFSKQGRGFKLIAGDPIEEFVNQTTVLNLKIKFEQQPKAYIYDELYRCCYQCLLKRKCRYRLGLYGSGWKLLIRAIF